MSLVRSRILVVLLWIGSLAAVAVWAQAPSRPEPRVISGSDIGYRIERTDRTGKPVGTIVVRIDGKWVEAGFAPGLSKLAQ
jgi:hypothetical protein